MATALVSEPPRPNVAMRRRSGSMPWKPVTTATSPSLKRRLKLRAVDAGDARRAVRGTGVDRDLPALPGARLQAHRLQHDGEEARRHLLAGGDDGIVLARVMQHGGFAHPGDELVGHARHGRDDDGDLVAGVHLALDVARDVTNALDVGDGRAAELHDNNSHRVSRRTASLQLLGNWPS